MATPPAPVNRFFGSAGDFFASAPVDDRRLTILRAFGRDARVIAFFCRRIAPCRGPAQPVVI